MNKPAVSVFWFRRDLRLDDNHGLFEALSGTLPVLPLFIFDSNILENLTNKQDKRVSFIYYNLAQLQKELKKQGSSFYIFYGKPLDAFKTILENYALWEVFTNNDYEPYAIKRDGEISDFLSKKNISFHSFKDQVIFEKNEVLKADHNPYTIFTPYSRVWKQKLNSEKINSYKSEKLMSRFLKTTSLPFPSLEKIGFESADFKIPEPVIDRKIISSYDKTRNFPAIDGTSHLGVHLRFGTVSIRKLVQIVIPLNEVYLNELIWREFFMMILFHFPGVVTHSFKKKYEKIKWRNNEKEFQAWRKGETGYPIVDAGMRELNETGFMHNRVRMVVASFLTKHLLIDWRWGEAYFAEKLLDYELSSNNGNWQWAAGCGCDAAPYFRIFNPAEQTKKFDPDQAYIKKWIGDLSAYHLTPIVEHNFARKRAIDTYKKALNETD